MFGRRYFGARFFGARYWGDGGEPHPSSYFGGRYFGQRYYGHRYWATSPTPPDAFDVEQTDNVVLTGVAALAGNIGILAALNVSQTTPVALTGALSLTDNIGFLTAWDFTPPLEVTGMTGAVAISGDIQIVTTHNVAVSAALALSGAATITGNLGTLIEIAPSTVTMTGLLAVAADIGVTLGEPHDIGTGIVTELAGALSIAGDILPEAPFEFEVTAGVEMIGELTLPDATLSFDEDTGPPSGKNRARGIRQRKVPSVRDRPRFLVSTEDEEFAEALEVLAIVLAMEDA